jgi:signal peptidase I
MRSGNFLQAAATIAIAVVWFVALRPVALGGPASYIVVKGYSMAGTLTPGDLVVTMSEGAYSAGDSIVYRVSSGAGRGLLVVHRIIRVGPDGYTTQGDANSYQDPWQPKDSDVVGRLVLDMPGFGRVAVLLANPLVLGGIWGLVALVLGLSFLPDSSRLKPRRLGGPVTKPGLRAASKVMGLAATVAVIAMVGLVLFSAVVVISPAHATQLTLRSDVVSARLSGNPSTTSRPTTVRPVRGRPDPIRRASAARLTPPPLEAGGNRARARDSASG